MKTNIALIGMMGTSKSTTGKALAKKLHMNFLDIDDLIEYEEKPIPLIFEERGESGFRDVEEKKIARAAQFENVVISTGGGVVLREVNMQKLRQSAYIVLLTASSKEILRRVKLNAGSRPLLQHPTIESIEELYEKRCPLYRKYADIVIDTTDQSPKACAEAISDELLKLIKNK